MRKRAPILVVDDDRATLKQLGDALDDHIVHVARTVEDAVRCLREIAPAVVVLNPDVPGEGDLALLRLLREHVRDVPLLLVHDPGRAGVHRTIDGVTPARLFVKPIDAAAVSRAVACLIDEPAAEPDEPPVPDGIGSDAEVRCQGVDPVFRRAMDLATAVAASEASVLVTGESGTGKEMFADVIHQRSFRAGRPFVKINCAAMPAELIESELFGYRKGAFTGADQNRVGVLEMASGGSLLLDEIGEMPPALQAKLLRVLQERECRPLGGRHPVPIDFRLICTTNVDMRQALRTGAFREDLYFRISTIVIQLPALRQRPGDILPLATHFLELYARRYERSLEGFTAAARDDLQQYHWRGNVRELQNVIERAVILARGPRIDSTELPDAVRRAGAPADAPALPEGLTLATVERLAIVQALQRCGGNKRRAAQTLGLHRATLYSKMRRHGIAGITPARTPHAVGT